MANEKLEVQLFQRRGARSNWPLTGEHITYRIKGNKLPAPTLAPLNLIENLGGAGRRSATCYLQAVRVLNQEEGLVEYEINVITTEAWQPIKEEAPPGNG